MVLELGLRDLATRSRSSHALSSDESGSGWVQSGTGLEPEAPTQKLVTGSQETPISQLKEKLEVLQLLWSLALGSPPVHVTCS